MKIINPGTDPTSEWWIGAKVRCVRCGCLLEFEEHDPVRNISVPGESSGHYLPCPTTGCGSPLAVFLNRVPTGWRSSGHTVVNP